LLNNWPGEFRPRALDARATTDGYSTLNANIAAYAITNMSLVSPLAVNDPSQDWGLAYHTLKTYSTRTGPVPTSPGGDFLVRHA
jgi:hypothetical protein